MSEEKVNREYPKAMHGPDEGYAVVNSNEEEDALRADGWKDGHEYWGAKAEAPVESELAPEQPKKRNKKVQE